MLSETVRRLQDAYSGWGGYQAPSTQLTFNDLLHLRLEAAQSINERLQKRTSSFRVENLLALANDIEGLSSAELQLLRNKTHPLLAEESRLRVLVNDMMGVPLYSLIVPYETAH